MRARRAVRRTASLTALTLALFSALGVGQEPLVFGVVGDTGEVTPGLRGVIREMLNYRRNRANFDFMLLLGDNIYSDGIGRGIPKVFEAPFADLLSAGVQFYAVLGNHDIRRGTDLQINYPGWNMAGRRFYAFSKGERLVEFFGLDSTALSGEAEIARDRRESGTRRRARRARTQVTAHRR